MGLISRVKNWINGEDITHTDLNAEFDNILDNLEPTKIEDASADAGAMNATADPYPSTVVSLATNLKGEIQRLRYVIKQITGKSQWYVDPGVNIPRGWHSKLICQTNSSNPDYQIDIDADAVVVENSNGGLYQVTDINLTVDIAVSGLNGLDTGSEANSTWYYGWVIYNPTTGTTAGLLSISSTIGTITLPSGYTYGKIVTTVRNNSSGNLDDYYQNADYLEYTADHGVTSSNTATTFTDRSLSSTVSPIGYRATLKLVLQNTASNALGYAYIRKNGSSGDDGSFGEVAFPIGMTGDVADADWEYKTVISVTCDTSQIIEIKISGADLSLEVVVLGYWINI